jgi:TatD DNase family protein
MRLVDTHCHLDGEEFAADLDAVVARAHAAGVEALVAIGSGDGPPDLEAGLRVAARVPGAWATVGVHPHAAARADDEILARLAELAHQPKVLAIGEIGLDYHYDFSPRDVQRQVFTRQLLLAREAALPVVIHTREAWEDTLELLAASGVERGVFHCFSGGPREARQALDLGFHVSFAGMVTFPKATAIHEAARVVPDERLLIETDSPYLAPVPHRGKRNEPAFLVHTARRMAELRGTTLEAIAELTAGNWQRLAFAAGGGQRVH